jgi:uncharacterized protein
MRWQKKTVRAVNRSRGTVLGEHIRVADSTLTRIVGLLGEPGLQPGDGLLIDPSQGIHTWGMRFPIDVVVLDDDLSTIGLRHCMGPFRMTRLFWKGAVVIELPSGTLQATSTSLGDSIEFTSNPLTCH